MRKIMWMLGLSIFAALSLSVSAQDTQTLKVWGFVWTADWLESIKGGFEAAHPGVTVDVQRFEYDPYRDAIITTLASQSGVPDVVTLDPMWAGDLIRNGALAPLDGIDKEINPDDFVAGGWNLCQSSGVQYGVPADLDFNIVFYRKDIYDPAIKAAGLTEFPTNTEDFIKVAQEVAKTGVSPILLAQQDYYGFYQGFMTPYNARIVSDDGTQYTFNSPEAVEALTLYNDLVNKYKVALLWNAATDGEPINAIANSQVAAVMYGSWFSSELAASAPDLKGKWAIAPMPFGPTDRKYHAAVGGSCFSIPVAAQQQDLARQFLVYMEQPEVMASYYTVVGGVPALKTSWEHIDLTGINEYLGIPVAKSITKWAEGVRGMELPSAAVAEALGKAIYVVTKEGMAPKDALEQAVAESPSLQ